MIQRVVDVEIGTLMEYPSPDECGTPKFFTLKRKRWMNNYLDALDRIGKIR